jgi:hypothetical protein
MARILRDQRNLINVRIDEKQMERFVEWLLGICLLFMGTLFENAIIPIVKSNSVVSK